MIFNEPGIDLFTMKFTNPLKHPHSHPNPPPNWVHTCTTLSKNYASENGSVLIMFFALYATVVFIGPQCTRQKPDLSFFAFGVILR